MKRVVSILCALLLGTAASSAEAAPSNGRRLYKWVDEQGLTHYGDHIPPEYASQEQHVFNSQGVETDRIDAQRSMEQLAAEDQKKVATAEQQSRDRNLLSTYASVAEIERLRDQRLALVSDQIKVTGQFLDILNGRMKKLRLNMMHFKPYSDDPNAAPMTDQMAEDLVRTVNDIRTQEENLRQKRVEEATMTEEFASDIARFKELKGIH